MAFPEFLSTYETPYVPFPDKPNVVTVGDFKVHEYISPLQMRKYIEMLSNKVSLQKYEAVLVNMNGGMFLFNYLSKLQGCKFNPVKIEYHRPPEAYGATVTIPVPAELKGSRVLIVDDIYDTGGVLKAIMKDVDPSSQAVALVTKNGIPNQIQIPNITIGLKIDDKWVGGGGMDLGVPGEGDIFRNYPGLVVKI